MLAATGAAIAIAAIAPAALGQPSNDPAFNNTVMSVEGPTANVLAPAWVAVRKSGTRVVRDTSGTRVRISARSVLSQLITGARANAIPVTWTWYADFGAPYVRTINRVAPKGTRGWNYRVNSLYWSKGSNLVNLGRGDRVTWYWGAEKDTVLEIAAPADGIAPGAAVRPGSFTVQVNEVTWKRVRMASAGATVTYGAATATTGADGTATFTTTPGVSTVRATKASRIAATKQLCTIGAPECPTP
jgi:hypothetical protein